MRSSYLVFFKLTLILLLKFNLISVVFITVILFIKRRSIYV